MWPGLRIMVVPGLTQVNDGDMLFQTRHAIKRWGYSGRFQGCSWPGMSSPGRHPNWPKLHYDMPHTSEVRFTPSMSLDLFSSTPTPPASILYQKLNYANYLGNCLKNQCRHGIKPYQIWPIGTNSKQTFEPQSIWQKKHQTNEIHEDLHGKPLGGPLAQWAIFHYRDEACIRWKPTSRKAQSPQLWHSDLGGL